MPPEAKVFIAEDDRRWQENYARWLPDGGHEVVGTVVSVFDAADVIHGLKDSEVEIDVAIVDGNIGFSQEGQDGAAVVRILRREFPGTKIIGSSQYDDVRGADVNLHKSEMNPQGLVDAVTNL